MKDVERLIVSKDQLATDETNIILHATTYVPTENLHPNTRVVFIPGWSMEGKTRALSKIGKTFAQKTHTTVITLSSTFKKPHLHSLDQQTHAIEQFIQKSKAEKVLLGGYSEGCAKVLKTAVDLESRKKSGENVPEVEGILLFSPLGLSQQHHVRLASALAKAAFFHIPKETLREISHYPKDWQKFFEAAHAALSIFSTMGKRALRRGPIGYIQQIQQELINMAAPIPGIQDLQIPIVVVLGDKDSVVPPLAAQEQAQLMLPHAVIVELSQFGHHGMPFLEYTTVITESLNALGKKS